MKIFRVVFVLISLNMALTSAQAQTYQFSGTETTITLNPGTYDITAYGAAGGTGGGWSGGLGAEMEAQFTFATAVNLTVLVGGNGGGGGSGGGGGGGGGSFVVNGSTPLVIAGGGGGAGVTGGGIGAGGNAGITGNGGSGNGGGGGSGGAGGGGGSGGYTYTGGGGGGGGYSGNGSSGNGGGGISFLAGGAGGSGAGGGNGGFGGGAGGGGGGGGGGGYSGGGGAAAGSFGGYFGGGGGGGSYIDSSATLIVTELAGVRSGNGEVDIVPITEPTAEQTATGTAIITNNFVIGVSITHGGDGYTNTPLVRLIGGGGSGAGAYAVVSNGVVTSITVTNAGFGYTNAPLVVIEPPFILNPILGIAPMSFLSFSNLTVGGNYQLQQSLAWYWTNQPVSFAATNALYTQMVAGAWNSGNFRLALNPVPSQAFSTARMDSGFVVGATVTSGGSGYVTSPAVTIVGRSVIGAGAFSSISGGVVTSITVTNAGFGYTNTPTVQIAPPPAAAVFPTVQPVMRVDSASLAPYDNYQIQFMPAIGGTWENWSGGLFTPTDVTNSQFLFITNGTGFFRLLYEP